ncbi:hypothetical protein M413DRAFT_445443 [Hebeloma cylindrosporum]|uniref:BPL/LPL catalytic domain-containing protein n=1 Tax=Hebeloma cylindrosporum TaxID=76867 RepID=A0A0C2XUV1_HEBCY|nr:hypothetical protein M413DRAFT_445443 [Hebeloma cylindrosporum h7]
MNVLIYSGPEVLQPSLNHALANLRSILLPHYTVQPITLHSLTTQPWQSSCALLVLPRSRNRFVSVASKQVKDFVEAGGAYLMLGTGATAIPRSGGLGLGSTSLSLGLEAGETPLKLFDKFNNVYLMFDDDAHDDRVTQKVVDLKTPNDDVIHGIYAREGTQFIGFDDLKGLDILARCTLKVGEDAIAGLSMDVSKGRVALWGPNIEYSLHEEPVSSIISKSTQLSPEDIKASEKLRVKLLRATLTRLGLQVPADTEPAHSISRPLPQFLTSTPEKPTIVSQILDAIAAPRPGMQLATFKDANDEFYFHPLQESSDLMRSSRDAAKIASDPSTWQPKHIIVCRDGALPEKDITPLFDVAFFYKVLAAARDKVDIPKTSQPWGVGEALLYGEAITSTQTMLDKNPLLLSQLPTPLLSLASYQLAGRGRGSNIWLSPSGCLQFSLLLRVSLATFPANKLVFLQYLFALAVVEACRDETVLGPKAGEQVRLKWPNDLYAVGEDKDDLRKIGGVLVNTSFSGGKVDIVVGCGLNVLNLPPITSLAQLQPGARERLSVEKTAAAIMAKFEPMWTVFTQNSGSFAPFMDLYLKRWLHSDQLVTLTTTTPHTAVRIVGITHDHGLLRTTPERPALGSEYIDLQPDGNSFDIMAGLIKAKS